MKGTQTILPQTQITTTYDENNNLITEVKEDYDNNKISITIPEYYLTGNTQKPTEKPQLPEGEYKILIYQTSIASAALTQKPIHLIQMPFNLTFYHHDHLGTTRYITNENGEILHTTDTLAYGEELTAPYENDKDEVMNTITYTGHEKDYETGLTYMLARYYSQGYGRFLSPDPGYDYDQLDPMSWNLYSYVRGNPIVKKDPTGKEEWTLAETMFLNSLKKSERKEGMDSYQKGLGEGMKLGTGVTAIVAAPFVLPEAAVIVGAETTPTMVALGEGSAAISSLLDSKAKGKSLKETAENFVIDTVAGGIGACVNSANIFKNIAAGAIIEGAKASFKTKDIDEIKDASKEGAITYGLATWYALPVGILGEKETQVAVNFTSILVNASKSEAEKKEDKDERH